MNHSALSVTMHKLYDLRENFLPPKPDLENTLYGSVDQLGKTSEYFIMANRKRANAQTQVG